jgi:hypothetical protein
MKVKAKEGRVGKQMRGGGGGGNECKCDGGWGSNGKKEGKEEPMEKGQWAGGKVRRE